MNRILILFAHPALEKSRVQYRLVKAARETPGVYVHDLYQYYPDFMIDVPREQKLLRQHDIILLQHPFYWYSSPALLKEWQDLVLEFGFAYGTEGVELSGKTLTNVISTGGSRDSYRTNGYNRYTIEEFLRPFEQTTHLCGMHYLPPFVVQGTHDLSEADIDAHAEHYRQVLEKLQQNTPGDEERDELTFLNDWQAKD